MINKFKNYNKLVKNNKKTNKYIKILIYIILLWISIKIYKLSLEGCYSTNINCMKFYKKYKIYFILWIITFSLIIFILTISFYYLKYYYMVFFNIYLVVLLYMYDNHFNIHKHGYYSIFLSWISFFLLTWFYIIYKIIKINYLKNKKNTKIVLSLMLILFLILFYIKIKIDINKFNYGFNNEKKLTFGKLCKYEKINLNYYETFKYKNILLSYFESPYIESIEFLNNICSTCEYFSYPQPKDLPQFYLYYINTFKEYSIKYILGYKNENELNNEKNREIFIKINRKENTGIIFYNPQFNINTFNYKQNIISKDKNEKHNVINIFIDALSRQQFFRIFPKTRSFLKKHYFNKDSKDKIGYGYQFFRAHSIVPWTTDNWWAYRYGTTVNSFLRYNLNDLYKKYGYETANFFNSCAFYEGFTFYFKNLKTKIYFTEQTFYDHDSSSLFCDPNFYMNDYYNPYIGQYSFFKKKLYGKRPYDINFDFSKKFMQKLKELNKNKKNKVPFFQDLYFVDAHEFTQNVIKNMDDSFYNYFIYLKEGGYLKNTIISIFSDHGNYMNSFETTPSGLIEKSSPLLLVLLDEKLNNKYGKTLKENEQKLLNLGDLHKSFYQLLEKDNRSWYNYIDIFNKIIPDTRRCENANISGNYCFCK